MNRGKEEIKSLKVGGKSNYKYKGRGDGDVKNVNIKQNI